MKHTNHSTNPKNRLLELLTRSRHIRIPLWGEWAVLIALIAFIVFMTARKRTQLRAEWAAPDRPAIVALEPMKKQLLMLEEVEALGTDFVSLVEDIAELTRSFKEEDSPSVAATLNNLGNIYATQDEYEKAIPLFEQSKRLLTKHLGAEHRDVAIIDENMRITRSIKKKAVNTELSPEDDRLKAAP